MKFKRNSRLNLGLLVDSPFPHPSVKDRNEICRASLEVVDAVFDLYTDLVLSGEISRAERLLKAVQKLPKSIQFAFSAENATEYKNNIEKSLDLLTEARYWIKEIQMKYQYSSQCDDAVEKVNHLVTVMTYVSGKLNTQNVKATILTIN
jgi:hypothetical protein